MNEKHRRAYEKAKPAYEALMKFYPLTVEDLDGEIWRLIEGYDAYHVSNFGRVKSFYNCKIKILKPALNSGYLAVALYKDGKQKFFKIHRLVASAFLSNPEGKPQVNHKDGHTMNCFAGNLEWATEEENIQHAFDTGLNKNAQGEECYNAKFTNEQIVYIRENPERLTLKQLGEKFGVAPTVISLIQRGKSYKNASGSIRPKFGVPDEIRAAIRSEYIKGSSEYGCYGLAKKYGIGATTVLKIVKES